MMLSILQLASMLGAFILIWLAGWLVYRYPQIGWVTLWFLIVALKALFNPFPELLNMAGLSVTFLDIVALVFVAAALISFNTLAILRVKYIPFTLRFLLIVILGLFSISLARGVSIFGIGVAVNEARTWIYLASVTLWVLSLQPSSSKFRASFERWSSWLVIGLVCIAVYGFLAVGFGSASEMFISDAGELLDSRPILAQQAIILVLATLLLYSKWLRERRHSVLVLAMLGLIVVVLVQHRSVWIAFLGAFAIYVIWGGAKTLKAGIGITVGASFLLLLAIISGRFKIIIEALLLSASNLNTYEGRISGWLGLLDAFVEAGLFNQLFGFPMGTGWERIQDGVLVTWSPHNWYVTVLLRFGILGFALIVGILFIAFLKACKHRNPLSAALLAGVLFFCWPYNLEWLIAPFAVFAIATQGERDHLRSSYKSDISSLHIRDLVNSKVVRER